MNNLESVTVKFTKPIREIFAEQLRNGHSVTMNIKGESMFPIIRESDLVTVELVAFGETRIGDLIVYARDLNSDFTLHRLIKKSRDHGGRMYLSTRGDASRYGDQAVYPEAVYGKIVKIERQDGSVVNLKVRKNRFRGYLIAKQRRFSNILIHALKSTISIPIQVIRMIKNYCSK